MLRGRKESAHVAEKEMLWKEEEPPQLESQLLNLDHSDC